MLNHDLLRRLSKASMINLGSGPSAYAFDYEASGINGINLAMTPSAFGLEQALLDEYAAYFQKSAALILAVCPFSFGENRSNADPARYVRYYPILSRAAMDALPPPLPHWDESAAASADYEHPLFPYALNIDRDEVPTEAAMSSRIETMCGIWKREFGLKDFLDASQAEPHRAAFARERQALHDLIAAARKLALCPWVFLPPLHPALRTRISEAFFGAFVRDQLRDCPAPVLDFTADPRITADMFLGPVFLNRQGAAALTHAVWEQAGAAHKSS